MTNLTRSVCLALTALAGTCAASSACAQGGGQDDGEAYLDASLSAEERAADLVSHMTLEEKAWQTGNAAPAIPRLDIPAYDWWNEGLHGVARAGFATVFPQAIGLAATWDRETIAEMGEIIRVEFRAKRLQALADGSASERYHGLTVWSPNINIFRDPRWGRGQETYGEDPYLTGEIAIAFIKSLQGDDPDHPWVNATAKHYAVHSGPESNRHREDIHPSPYDFEDTYLPAFRAAVVEGGVDAIMCAYNAVDGVPACASEELMQTILRDQWDFDGYVLSDCGGAANVYREDSLNYVDTGEEAVTLSFNAGMDLICGDFRNEWSMETEHIIAAVENDMLDEAVLDRSLERLFTARIRLGLFDEPDYDDDVPYADVTAEDNDTPEHRAKSVTVAEKSMVLLKNDGLLPIREAPDKIAVIGPNADSLDALIGNYYGTPSHPVTILDGVRKRFADSEITYVQGTGLIGPAETPVPDDVLCLDKACAKKGLKAEHFDNENLQGEPVSTGVESNAAFEWFSPERHTSVRWTGYLKAPESGEYRFRFSSQNGYRVFVDGKTVIDEWGVGDAPSIASGAISLEEGEIYPIRVEGFQRGLRGEQKLVWSRPSDATGPAVAAATDADLVIFVGGLTARVEGEEMRIETEGFAGGDRTAIGLPAPQQTLLKALHETGKPVVFVLMNGSAVAVNWADENIPAIIEAWYPGGQGGDAVANLIAGDFSPAGRLPVTFYRSVDQLPAFTDYSMEGRTYRYFDGEVLYPFGYGLSYSSFDYGKPKLSAKKIEGNGEVTVSVEVTNTGDMDSDEVAQLYVTHKGVSPAPIRALQGFKRIHLKKGESKTVSFTLKDRALSVVGEDGARFVPKGKVEIWVGGGQPVGRDGLPTPPGGKTTLRITSSTDLPD
ncbi:glycoside hydrolase family 3 protein [Hyphococcus luteus]|uniref:Glucan 1,4-alpha-glucosidase n=1 Tax=Hyphococcus luteus TaxID=2058213 RepID=A0A2S7JYZ7_9PROT|nr:glycoside hydrolase family 3 protein [Marinicaulis flavus]PQA85471.1 glucan 1,4-alpha-glucosidase [Marinicaulis flavus]